MSVGTLFENATLVTHDRIARATLAFHGDRISAPGGEEFRLDLTGHLVLPGLVNAHDHLQLNCFPRLEHPESFPNSYAWINAFDDHHRDAAVIAVAAIPKRVRYWQGGLKNVLSGATTVVHHDPWDDVLDAPAFPVRVANSRHWCHSLGLGGARSDVSQRYGPEVIASFQATPRGEPWTIHLAEGTDAVAGSEFAALEALGCVASSTVIVHGVGMPAEDIERVIAVGATVVWCPASNLGMLGKTLDPRRLADAGCLALGTDSRLTGARDLLDELRVAKGNSTLTNRDLLRLVTNGKSLEIGAQADCIVLRETSDPYDALLDTQRADIRAVVRDGKPVVADVDLVDWFRQTSVDHVEVRLDGHPKLVARSMLMREAAELEDGLELR